MAKETRFLVQSRSQELSIRIPKDGGDPREMAVAMRELADGLDRIAGEGYVMTAVKATAPRVGAGGGLRELVFRIEAQPKK